MRWEVSHRAFPRAVRIADRHYSRQKPGTSQFVPPSTCVVLLSEGAVWATTWPKAEFTKHAWAGAWINSIFRREPECPYRASDLIRDAVAATRWFWPDVPSLGLISFVDASKVRHKRDPGRCFRKAGFKLVGKTESGKLAFQLTPDAMPDAEPPLNALLNLEIGA